MRTRLPLYLALFAAVPAQVCVAGAYLQENLVSDVPGLATFLDPNLSNPWGISSSPTGPIWVSNQVTGTATVYNGAGQPQPQLQPLVVTIPGGEGPTGQVFNDTADAFALTTGGKAAFLFAGLDGSIAGWNGAQGTLAQIPVPAHSAEYTGLAIGNNGAGNFLYAADSLGNKIDVYNGLFTPTTLAGTFTDPNLPAGFTVYNIQQVGGVLLVTYENEATGGGIVNAFDLNGNFLRRVTSNGDSGPLESPWGLTLAPTTFGQFGGALLVGNEDDGRISAFEFNTGAFLGQLLDPNGNPIENTGLWGLKFGNGGNGGDPNKLYFAAGINEEVDGLFGSIAAVAEPPSIMLLGLVAMIAGVCRWRRRRV